MTSGNNLHNGQRACRRLGGRIVLPNCAGARRNPRCCHNAGSKTLFGNEPKNRSRKARTSK
jgi:hypothetical protein